MTHKDLFKQQKAYIKILADANDIPFDENQFKDKVIRQSFLHKCYRQSDAARYIGQMLEKRENDGKRLFFPWNTSFVPSNLNGMRYNANPWFFVPLKNYPEKIDSKKLIDCVSFEPVYDGQAHYINGESGRESPVISCKNCGNKWKHFSGRNKAYDDITEDKHFCCPICKSRDVYFDGFFFWD